MRDPQSPVHRPSLVWKRPNPLGQVELVRGLGGIASPLMVGFSLAAISILVTSDRPPRFAEWGTAAFSLASLLLLFAMRYAFMVLRHSASPGERIAWFPEARVDAASLAIERLNQAEDVRLADWYARIAEILFELGQLAFLSGLVILLIPTDWASGRTLAFTIALVGSLIQFILFLGVLRNKPPKRLMKTRDEVTEMAKERLSTLDDVSRASIMKP